MFTAHNVTSSVSNPVCIYVIIVSSYISCRVTVWCNLIDWHELTRRHSHLSNSNQVRSTNARSNHGCLSVVANVVFTYSYQLYECNCQLGDCNIHLFFFTSYSSWELLSIVKTPQDELQKDLKKNPGTLVS